MSDPRTEAGRWLADNIVSVSAAMSEIAGHDVATAADRAVQSRKSANGNIAAIEAEAVAAYRARLAEAVEGLPKWDKRAVPGGFHVNRAAVLALLRDTP